MLILFSYNRLALPIGIIIALYITVLPLIGNGPIWNSYFFNEARYCKENWYLNMIFVNNVMFKPGTSYVSYFEKMYFNILIK